MSPLCIFSSGDPDCYDEWVWRDDMCHFKKTHCLNSNDDDDNVDVSRELEKYRDLSIHPTKPCLRRTMWIPFNETCHGRYIR